jgi:hypothetical protein
MRFGVVRSCLSVRRFIPHTTPLSAGFIILGIGIAEGTHGLFFSCVLTIIFWCTYNYDLCRHHCSAHLCAVGAQKEGCVDYVCVAFGAYMSQ